MESLKSIVFLSLLIQASLLPLLTLAADPDPLQDLCVADLASTTVVNGFVCKPAATVTVNDFVFNGLEKAGNTKNPFGFAVTPAFVFQLPGLNTQGISIARLDFAKGGLDPIHTHPRATEILTVVEGELYVGFVTTANQLFATTLKKGGVFVFPRGLVHFQLNVGNGKAVAIAALNSQNPGVQQVAASLFASTPPINDVVLEKDFGISDSEVKKIRANLP